LWEGAQEEADADLGGNVFKFALNEKEKALVVEQG
jgi:hypothetical protein